MLKPNFTARNCCLLLLISLIVLSFSGPRLCAQQWETIKAYDFSDPNFTPSLGGVNGFQANQASLSDFGATGAAGDRCASLNPSSNLAYIAMRQPLLAGEVYRLALNGKTTNASQMSFCYGEYAGPFFLAEPLAALARLPLVLDPHQPGAEIQTMTFTVPADGMYWLTAYKPTQGTVWLDDFALQRQVPALLGFSLTLGGAPAPELIEATAGFSFELCLVPDVPPSRALVVGVAVQGGGPHFPSYARGQSFPAGSSAPQCFTLSPASEDVEQSYLFNIILGRKTVGVFKVLVSPGCPSVAGPDRTICAGESTQLGTGCLPAPHPLEGVEYCYRWVPWEGLMTSARAMPIATPTETTTYTVYVTNSVGDLVAEDTVTVKVNTIEVEELVVPRTCPGEEVNLSVNPLGEGPFRYFWSVGLSGPSITLYPRTTVDATVLIKDDGTGCERAVPVRAFVHTMHDFNIITASSALCELADLEGLQQNSANRSAAGSENSDCQSTYGYLSASTGIGSLYSYEWSTGKSGSISRVDAPGNYSVTVTNNQNGCSEADYYEMPSCAAVDIVSNLGTEGASVLDAGPGFVSYEWHDGSTGQTIAVSGPGLYAVTVVNEQGCVGKDSYFIAEQGTLTGEAFLIYYTVVEELYGKFRIDVYISSSLPESERERYGAFISAHLKKRVVHNGFVGIDNIRLSELRHRHIWSNQVVHSSEHPVKRNGPRAHFVPLMIQDYQATPNAPPVLHWASSYYDEAGAMKPYHFQLGLSPASANGIDAYNISGTTPAFAAELQNAADMLTATLSVGKEEGTDSAFDNTGVPPIELTFKVEGVEGPHKYVLYMNNRAVRGEEEVVEGSRLQFEIWDRTAGKWVKKGDKLYSYFMWKDTYSFIGRGVDLAYEVPDLRAVTTKETTLSVQFEEIIEGAPLWKVTLAVELRIIEKQLLGPGIHYPSDDAPLNNSPICSAFKCSNHPPSHYIDLAMSTLSQSGLGYDAMLNDLENKMHPLRIKLSTGRPSPCSKNNNPAKFGAAEAGRWDVAQVLSNPQRNRVFLGTVETWGSEAPSYSDCPKSAELLVRISVQEKMEIDDAIENNSAPPDVVGKLIEKGTEIEEWIYNTGASSEAKDYYLKEVNDLFHAGRLAYPISQYTGDFADLVKLKGDFSITLFVDNLEYVPYYATCQNVSGENQDTKNYFNNTPNCNKVYTARAQKYTQVIAHELRHLHWSALHLREAYEWHLIRTSQSLMACYPSSACSLDGGHEYGNPDGENACLAEEHFPEPQIND